MDVSTFIEQICTQGPWALMFVWLFYVTKEESKDRESKLMQVIESYNEKLTRITDTLDAINDKIDRFHGKDAQ